MKKTYEAPKAEAVKFDNTDIIRTSEQEPAGCRESFDFQWVD